MNSQSVDRSRLDPIRTLFWSAVINGVAAVPIMAAMMAAAAAAVLIV